ncbi:DUF4937 domain-containing protein [Shewanella benthica]|uniref:DUF4937 domain-containing protein n=1 Tax=Shewanella benthica TaxID=43661 RepID=UPI0018797CA4|nr:DUF4937 domain-containing protein [Shewanella benthica]MBE7216770.1 DUF4937 domain-containing protein [Shewanella benthica]MCL1064973.1 DUF4937 domain-containing protein [Shewanella benthica]
MIAKYIRCEVPAANRENFSKGQSLWQATAHCQGFISQLGGWDLSKGKSTSGKAMILARWSDMESVKNFMRVTHAPIAEETNQDGTYSTISVSYLQLVMSIPALNQHQNHHCNSQVGCGFIRIEDCYIDPEKANEFMKEQARLWNPGMQRVEGMLGGQVWLFNDKPQRYLVTTYWENEAAHRHYASHYFPALKQQAATDIIQSISGYHIQTEPSWQITP